MATKRDPEPANSPKPNREQRRREKFGNAGNVTRHDPLAPWPESEANPAFGRSGDDQSAAPGPGTGGATKGNERGIDHKEVLESDSEKG